MKIHLATSETKHDVLPLIDKGIKFKWNLFSFYALNKSKPNLSAYFKIRNNSESILVDSGAFSFQKGTKVNWDEFTKNYIDFIQKTDNEKVTGYFELDIDNIIGYDAVLEYRQQLKEVSNKIIPVWHKNRGVHDFKIMCQNYKYVAIASVSQTDILDKHIKYFVDYAHKQGCKIHGLGITRKKILDKIPFDSVDSTSWIAPFVWGRIGNKKIDKQYYRDNYKYIVQSAYIKGIQFQKYYYNYWLWHQKYKK